MTHAQTCRGFVQETMNIVGQRAARATLVHKFRTRAVGPGLWWEFVLRASCVVRVGPCEDLFAMCDLSLDILQCASTANGKNSDIRCVLAWN